jgi:hypothetical protein
LEELEELVSKKARLLSRTDNVALYRVGTLEIVKVGLADLAEEAWWRYGRQLPHRSRILRWTPAPIRRLRFGGVAWVGQKACQGCEHVFREIPFTDSKILVVRPGEGTFSLTRRCPHCRDVNTGGLHLTGIEAELTLARIMAFQRDIGESRVTVRAAVRLLADPGGPVSLIRVLSSYGRPIGGLQPIGLTALEIVVNSARERALLKLEVEGLQARWRREEELAALVDGVLSPVPLLRLFKTRARGPESSPTRGGGRFP